MTVKDVQQAWFARGFSCEISVDPPGLIWENIVHDADELFMVVDGDVELELEGTPLHPKPFQEIMIPRKSRHTLRNIGCIPARWHYGFRQENNSQSEPE